MRREISIVLYHRIAENEHSLTKQLGVTTKPDTFERHIRYFAQNFDFVSGYDLITGALPRKPILVTFDDAYRSVLDIAGPILKAVKAPSVFFINPATVTRDSLPMDNILSLAVEELGWDKVLSVLNLDKAGITSTTQLIANIVPTMKQAEVNEAKQSLCSAMGTTEAQIRVTSSNLFLDVADLETFTSFRIEIGNHSMSHTFFRSLSWSEMNTEIVKSRTLLQDLSGQPILYLSIPYGNMLDATEHMLDVARHSGHKAIFLVHAKSNRFRPAPDIFYRTSLENTRCNGVSFKLRVSPVLRSIRDWLW